MNVSCAQKILPLTTSVADVKSNINSMTAGGDTYIPAGLLWAYNMLTPGAPLSLAAPFDPDGSNLRPLKAIVLMTDGKNSRSAQGAKHTGTNEAGANSKMTSLCDNVKAKNIAVYTVAFQVPDETTKSLLESCATEPANYYDAANSSALLDAFSKIAKSLKKVRLAR